MTTKQQRCSRRKVSKSMREFKHGTLTLASGKQVINRKQAIAIALSMSRKFCKPHNMRMRSLAARNGHKTRLSLKKKSKK